MVNLVFWENKMDWKTHLLSKASFDCLNDAGNIDTHKFVAELTETQHSKSLIYCVDRLVRIRKFYDPSKWTNHLPHGYTKLVDDLISLQKMGDRKRFEYVLVEEYGYLLPCLKNKKWTIENIRSSQLRGGDVYRKKLDKMNKTIYANHTLPIGVYHKNSGGYQLIDGYLRYVAMMMENVETVEIIVAS
jgi:hypothetical protein